MAPVQAATSAAAPAAATQNGSVADIRPTRRAPVAVAAKRDHWGAGVMKRSERTLSAMLACNWMPGKRLLAERRLEVVDEAGGRQTDENDLVLEDTRIDVGLFARLKLTLGAQEIARPRTTG